MRLTSTGLGIGTSSPASALYVKRTSGNSGIYTDYNGTNVGRIEAASNGNLYIGLTTGSGDLSIGNTANANAFILNSSGNLGLGVTPSAWNAYVALQIGNGFLANYAATADTYIGSNAYYQSGFKYTTSGQAASAIQIANGGFGFKIAPSGTAGNAITFTQAMTLDASGRLQIGTTNSASATIRGLGASNANAYYYLDANGPFGGSPSYSSILGFALYTDSGARYNSHAEIACVADSNYSGSLTFSTQNPGTYPNTVTERMRLASGGQLLIGTTTLSGTNRLVVATTTAIDAAMTVKAELANYASIINIEAQNDNGAIYNYIASNTTGVTQHWKISGGAATNTMAFSTAGSERARIDSSGNLLVGTTTAYAHFASKAVAGQAAGWFSVATNGDAGIFFANASNTTVGSVTVNSAGVLYNITSDYRLKNVIGAVTGHGERLDALEPIEYELKSDNSRTRGFLAHKFQEVYASSVSGSKDAVDANGNPVYQTMQASTSEVIADLVAEIQSLRKRLADAGI